MKLTEKMREMLLTLEGCTAPWDAQHRTNRAALGKLHLLGCAAWVDGGWVITEAGRAALRSPSVGGGNG